MEKSNGSPPRFRLKRNKIVSLLFILASVSLLTLACDQPLPPSTETAGVPTAASTQRELHEKVSQPTTLPNQQAEVHPSTATHGVKSTRQTTPAVPRILSSTTKSPDPGSRSATNLQTPPQPPASDNSELTTSTPTRENTPSAPAQTRRSDPSERHQSTPNQPALLTPTTTPVIQRHREPAYVNASGLSLDIYALHSDFIVLARLLSIGSGAQTIPSEEGAHPIYRPLVELTFEVVEYLKGNGPTTLLAEAPTLLKTYLTQEEAAKAASKMAEKGVAIDDGSISVVFLEKALHQDSSRDDKIAADSTTRLTFRNIHARIDPGTGTVPATGQHFLADTPSPWRVYPHPETRRFSFSLDELQSHITKIESLLEAGKGVEGYEPCLEQRFVSEMRRKDWEAFHGKTYSAPTISKTISSGQGQGTEIENMTHADGRGHGKHWSTSPHEGLFQVHIVDSDNQGETGYTTSARTTRPLPNGVYQFRKIHQFYFHIPCNYVPKDDVHLQYEVTVIPPEGTLHEAFFDPKESDGAIGTLDPNSFSAKGADTTIKSLTWKDQLVTMEITPINPLEGHTMDFIALDGSVATSLSFDDATVDTDSATLTWDVENQPWQDGDQLMLRIR